LAVERAVRALRVSATGDSLRLQVPANEIAEISAAPENSDLCEAGSVCAELFRDRIKSLVDDQMAELQSLATRLASLEGQKHVVLLSDGFDPAYVHGVASRARPVNMQQVSAPSIAGKTEFRAGPPLLDAKLLERTKTLHVAYGTAGVFLDAIDTAGLRPGGITEENEALVMMARDTGGQIIEHRNDLGEALQVLTDRSRVVYILGFHAHGTARKENSITVRLRNVDGHPDFRYRRTFSTVANASPRVDTVRLADIL